MIPVEFVECWVIQTWYEAGACSILITASVIDQDMKTLVAVEDPAGEVRKNRRLTKI